MMVAEILISFDEGGFLSDKKTIVWIGLGGEGDSYYLVIKF